MTIKSDRRRGCALSPRLLHHARAGGADDGSGLVRTIGESMTTYTRASVHSAH
jgi:hypothetical protein